MNKAKLLFLFIGIALVFFALQANAYVSLTSDYDKFELNKGDTQPISLKISNTENTEKEVVLEALTNNQLVKAYLPATTLAVPANSSTANSSTSVSLQVYAPSIIPSGDYTVTVNAFYADGQSSRLLYFKVGSSIEYLNLSLANNIACLYENSLLKLQLTNDSNVQKTAVLGTESELFLPTLDTQYITLDANKTKFFYLTLHANDSVKEGTYPVTIILQTPSKLTRKNISVQLIDCTKKQVPDIEFWASATCIQLSKDTNQVASLSFNIKNRSESQQTIDLSVESGLNALLSSSSATLAANETQSKTLTVSASGNTEPGLQPVKLVASRNNQRMAEYDINCVNVNPIHSTSMDASPLQGTEISIGATQSFEITISNNGDEIEDYTLSINSIPSGLNASFSQSTLSIPAKESRKVMLSISPGTQTTGGSKTIALKAQGKSTVTQSVSFTVLTSVTLSGQIEFVSWPAELSINSGQDMTVLVKIKNAKNNELNDLIVKLLGAESFIEVSQPSKQMHITPSQERTISIPVKAKENLGQEEVSLTLQAKSQGITEEKTVKLLVNKPLSTDQNESLSGIPSEFASTPSGFVALGSMGSLGLLVVIIVIVLAFIYYSKQKPESIKALKEAIKKVLKLN